jgi:hypothetical protein
MWRQMRLRMAPKVKHWTDLSSLFSSAARRFKVTVRSLFLGSRYIFKIFCSVFFSVNGALPWCIIFLLRKECRVIASHIVSATCRTASLCKHHRHTFLGATWCFRAQALRLPPLASSSNNFSLSFQVNQILLVTIVLTVNRNRNRKKKGLSKRDC